MSNTIKLIAARAKQIRKKCPAKAWQTCIKEASREIKAGKKPVRKAAPKKAARKAAPKKAAKRKKVGAVKYIESGEKKSTPAKKVYRITRAKTGTFKKVSRVAGVSNAGTSQDAAIQRVIMKRALRQKGVLVESNIMDADLQSAYRKLTGRKVPQITRIRAMLKKEVKPDEIIKKLS